MHKGVTSVAQAARSFLILVRKRIGFALTSVRSALPVLGATKTSRSLGLSKGNLKGARVQHRPN
jgi:hypothetical protein